MDANQKNLFQQVYEIVKKIPAGKVVTYGQVAEIIGSKDSRKVGWALHANKDESKVPCHRVVNKDGCLAPGYAFGGPNEQRIKLIEEGVVFTDQSNVDLKRCLWQN